LVKKQVSFREITFCISYKRNSKNITIFFKITKLNNPSSLSHFLHILTMFWAKNGKWISQFPEEIHEGQP
jgi:hypothetical protein